MASPLANNEENELSTVSADKEGSCDEGSNLLDNVENGYVSPAHDNDKLQPASPLSDSPHSQNHEKASNLNLSNDHINPISPNHSPDRELIVSEGPASPRSPASPDVDTNIPSPSRSDGNSRSRASSEKDLGPLENAHQQDLQNDSKEDGMEEKIEKDDSNALSNSRERQSKSRTPSVTRSENNSPSRSRSRSRSRSVSVKSRSRSRSKSIQSRSRSRSASIKSRSRSRSGSVKSRSRSRSGSVKSRSRSRSGSVKSRSSRGSAASRSVSRHSRSRSGSRSSRSRSRSGSRRSKSGSRSRSGSRSSRSGSRSRSRSGSRRSKSGSRSRSRSVSRSRVKSRSVSRSSGSSRSRSRSGSSRSRSGSPTRNRRVIDSDSDSNASKSGSKVRRRSSGSDSDSGLDRPSRKKARSRGSVSPEGSVRSRSRSGSRSVSGDRSRSPSVENQNRSGAENLTAKDVDSDAEDDAIRDELRRGVEQREEEPNDFDAMMARRKEENSTRRRRKANVDIINDNEENIALIVRRMRQAADEDRQLNQMKKPATKKIAMMDLAMNHLKKFDLIEGFLEANVLTALTDWLAPMPDKSLPSTKIREMVLKWLIQLPSLNQDMLKTSGIGKAVMYLYKHPKELKANKECCGRLISIWSRPIFNNSDDFKALSKEERTERDLELSRHSGVKRRSEDGNQNEEMNRALRPGDPGWCFRARVPAPSTKDYVNRPKWQRDTDISKTNKKQASRLDKQLRAFKDKQRQAKAKRAVSISIEGRNMAL